jgi:hypothetical protein
MRRWPAILGALAAILVPGILIAQIHTNPSPNDVWTYFGPTLGGGWGAPPGGGTGSPGGTTGQLQWNNAGTFGGVTVGGDFTINTTTGIGTINPNAVTTGKIIDGAVTNAKLATPSITIAGITFNLGGSITSAALTAALGPCSTTLQGTVPASGGGTTNFLRADCTWAAPPGGGGGSVSVTSLTPDIQVSPSPGTGTFTVGKYGGTTVVGDANCGTLTNATGAVLFNAPFTAAHSCTLPAASTMQTWQEICFNDVSNGTAYAINGTNTLTVNRAGSDKIETATSAVMGVGGAKLCFKAVSSSAWAQTQNTNLGAQAATSNNFLTGLGSDGVYTRAQVGFSNLSGTAAVTQGGTGLTAVSADQVAVGTASNTYTAKSIGDCDDATGNHLNYDTTTHAFSCGVTVPANTAKLDVNQSFTKGQAVTPVTGGAQSAGGTYTADFANSNSVTLTFGAGNLTIANPSNVKAGQSYVIALTQDGTGGRTVTWGSNFKWASATAPTLSTGASAKDIISCFADTTTTINCTLAVKGVS